MRIVFFGTPEYVLPILKTVHKEFKSKEGESPIAAVVTQEPKPVGRKKLLRYTAIDEWAFKRDVPKYFNSEEIVSKNIVADIGILAAYGEIIPKRVIDHFPHGILNIHPSLLPKYRGASPVQAAIIAGDKKTGVSVIKMDEKLDHGPIVSSFDEKIKGDDTTETLRNRLFERSARFVRDLIPAYIEGEVNTRKQDHKNATVTTIIKRDDAFIEPKYLRNAFEGKSFDDEWNIPFIKDFSMKPSPEPIGRFIRAMQPWPDAWTLVNIKGDSLRLKIKKANLKKGTLNPEIVQLEGKNEVSWKQFSDAYDTTEIFE